MDPHSVLPILALKQKIMMLFVCRLAQTIKSNLKICNAHKLLHSNWSKGIWELFVMWVHLCLTYYPFLENSTVSWGWGIIKSFNSKIPFSFEDIATKGRNSDTAVYETRCGGNIIKAIRWLQNCHFWLYEAILLSGTRGKTKELL